MRKEYIILLLLDLIERGIVYSVTVNKQTVTIRIKNNRP